MSNYSTIKIRRAEHKEAAAISALIFEAFVDERPQYSEGAFAITTPGISEIEERIRDNSVWVAVQEEVIAGTASCVRKGEGLFIKSVAVSRGARGKGIGRKLLEHMERLALEMDCRQLSLTTTAFLLPACRLYDSLGFKYNGVEDCHGTQLVKMKKNLNPFSSKIKLQRHDQIN